MYQNYKKGGLRVPNADVMTKSLRLTWISRLLAKDDKRNEVWKTIPNHFFDMYGGLNFLLRCNYDSKFLERTGMPQFYNQGLKKKPVQSSGTSKFSLRASNFLSLLAPQARTQASRSPTKFLITILRRKG